MPVGTCNVVVNESIAASEIYEKAPSLCVQNLSDSTDDVIDSF